jgi:hypothetical protein
MESDWLRKGGSLFQGHLFKPSNPQLISAVSRHKQRTIIFAINISEYLIRLPDG